MFLSFIVPVYNAERYIGECLASLLEQDIEKEDYEIVCVNDGSRDASPVILQQWQEQHPNIVILHQGNGGVVSARNAGLGAARGEYIWFVDADDFIKPNILGTLREKVRSESCDRLILGGYEFTDALTEKEKQQSQKGQLPINCPWYDSVVWRGLLRREFLEEHNLFFRYPDLTHGEDGLYMYEVSICNPATAEIGEALYFYRVHSGSAETAQSLANQKKKLRCYIRIAAIMKGHYDSGKHDAVTANKLMTFLHFALYMIAAFPQKEAGAAMKQLKEEGLFPYHRPKGCTLETAYILSPTSVVGKIFDKVYLNMHRPWGYALMRLLQRARALLRR